MALEIKPRHPVYIVSKGRWMNGLTSKALDVMGVPYKIVVERQEYSNYAVIEGSGNLLVLPQRYLDRYDTCDELGDMKGKGPGAARNFAWDHAYEQGATYHWVMDDNLDAFHRLNRNTKYECESPAIFRAAEDFIERYNNVAIAGFNYYSFRSC